MFVRVGLAGDGGCWAVDDCLKKMGDSEHIE